MRKLFVLGAVVLGTSVGLSLSSNVSYASAFDTVTVNVGDFKSSLTSPVESKNNSQNRTACDNGCGGGWPHSRF